MAATDPALEPVRVLGEVAGAFYPHPQFERIPEAPYQHLEMLGAIWRESPLQGLPKGRRPMMMGALPQCDAGGRPVISALIELSGLGHEAWLERLFSTVFVPLYHFLCRYGVGFIAHGQNITVILEGDVPVGVAVIGSLTRVTRSAAVTTMRSSSLWRASCQVVGGAYVTRPTQGSRKSATHGSPKRRFTARPARCALSGEEVGQSASIPPAAMRRTAARSASRAHARYPS